MMEASSRGGVRTWPNQVVTPSSSILHLEMEHSSPSKKWIVLKEDQLPLFHCNECLVLTDSSRVTI